MVSFQLPASAIELMSAELVQGKQW